MTAFSIVLSLREKPSKPVSFWETSQICMEKKFFKSSMPKQMAYAAGEWPALPLIKTILYWQWELFIDFPFYNLKGCLKII